MIFLKHFWVLFKRGIVKGGLYLKLKLLLLLSIVGAIVFYVNQSEVVSELPDVPNLHSKQALLLHVDSGKLLLEQGGDEKIYPASLTKIMTAILAIEYFDDLDQQLSIDGTILKTLKKQNASVAGFNEEEVVTVKDLLYGTLLSSGADATTTLANAISGSEENFSKMMNDKAIILKMKNTHFKNASGLHDPEHYSSVSDIAKLLTYALENKKFKRIFTSEQYLTAPTISHIDGLQLQNSLFSKINNYDKTDWKLLGGKTGYTPEAGMCLATLVKKKGKEYILITVGAEGQSWSYPYHVEDAVNVFEKL